MVSLVKTFLSALCLTGVASARYSNDTTPSASTVPKSSPTAFFSNVQFVDSYTGSNLCNDKEHWFLLEAEVYVSAGFKGELYLTAPQSLEGFPKESFDLVQNVTAVGTVARNASNVFTIRPDVSDTDRSSTFNVLALLSSETKSSIDSPQTLDFDFEVSPGSTFTKSIEFIAQDLSKSQTNARVDENNRITYTMDIPFSEYPGALNFAASFSGKEAFTFDTSLSYLEVVTAVDAFNQPTRGINLTAFEDNSDASAINLSLDSQISGGKFIRISYTTAPIVDAVSVETVATLNYPTLSSYKRDISITFEDLVVLNGDANIDNIGEQIFVVTGSGSFPTVTGSNSTKTASATSDLASNTTVGPTASISPNTTSLQVSSAPSANVTMSMSGTTVATSNSTINTDVNPSLNTSIASITSAPIQQSSVNASNTAFVTSNSNGAVLTYSVVTRTSDGEYEVFTSFFPVATLSSQSRINSTGVGSDTYYVVNATTPSTIVYPTQTVFNKTVSGEVAVFTSLIPVATVGNSKSNAVTALSSSSSSKSTAIKSSLTKNVTSQSTTERGASSSQGAQSQSTTSASSKTTQYQTKAYLAHSVVTTTSDGKVFEYTSWFPTLAQSSDVSVTSPTESASDASTTSLTKSKSLVATTLTQTKGGQVSLVTTKVPVETLTTKSSELSASKSSTSKKHTETYHSVPVNTTVLNSPEFATQSFTTKYGISTGVLASTQSGLVSVSEKLIGAATLSSSSKKAESTKQSPNAQTSSSSSALSVATNIGVLTGVSQAIQSELLTTYEAPIGASTEMTSATGTQENTLVSTSYGSSVQRSATSQPTPSRSTLSGSYTIEYQSQTSQASSTRVLSTFDGAGIKLRADIFGAFIPMVAYLL
ncbi:LAFA_0C02234g1_1 [Lachancea sp. 'fantastica']|nr:LAFA_0C02234g1_1 [Lachancea sp. 'fantastica']